MSRPTRWIAALVLALPLAPSAVRADLDAYLKRPEPAYKCESTGQQKMAGGTAYTFHLVSQTWQGIPWEHNLWLFRPDRAKYGATCGLMNTGGSSSPEMQAFCAAVASKAGIPFAILFNIPKQPLYGGKSEDALVVHTWLQFLQTGDESWPLHFPMAKAVIKAMDAIQAFAKTHPPAITGFVVTGASKRGWTTWLVGASRDRRVKAIAPMVIDTLNLPVQLKAQQEVYGSEGSAEINDYAAGGVLNVLGTERGKRLVELEDPYSYRTRYVMPKLIILGTNDPYWPQDALNHYWDGIPSPKWVLYTPNSGHGLDDRARVAATLTAFMQTVASSRKWPTMSWSYEGDPPTSLSVSSDVAPVSARLFRVAAPTRDFRASRWTSSELPVDGRSVKAELPAVATGYMANFCELTYNVNGSTFTLSTQLRVRGATP